MANTIAAQCLEGQDTLAERVVYWQKHSGRHHLPWQGTRDPYRIWLSEIMLQQTQVATVIPYYHRFLERFPSVDALANASLDELMPYWAGLGYYARARHLHRCARMVCETHGGRFPATAEQLATLPGIGRSTAAAIAAFAWDERRPIMDGNVKRVFARYFGVYGASGLSATESALWNIAEKVLAAAPAALDMAAYTQGLMDLGSTICTRHRPECTQCPLASDCYARRHGAQQELPERRRRKQLPERDVLMLILESDGKVLLEQRPSHGIWGGLLSLPEFDSLAALEASLSTNGPGYVQRQSPPGFSHGFSHFRLHIQAHHVYMPRAASTLSEPFCEPRWTSIGSLENAALPAPVRKLLAAAFAGHNSL